MAINRPIEIFKGDDPTIQIQFVTEDDSGVQKAEDLTGNTVNVHFPGEAADVVIAGAFDTDGSDGMVNVAFSEVTSLELKSGERQTFYAILDNAGVERTVKFRGLLTVDERNFR